MNIYKNKKLIYPTLFIVVSVLALYINVNYRYYQITIELSEFAFWMAVPAFVLAFLTLFLSEEVASAWRKFSNYFLLASVVIILLTPNSDPGNFIMPIIKENVTIVLATLYSAISLLLILYKSFKK